MNLRPYLGIPIVLCHLVIRKKFFRPFQIWLYLKGRCSGRIKITSKELKIIAQDLRVTPRTVKNNLKILKTKNWLGEDPNYRYYFFIRGLKKVMDIEKIEGRKAICTSIKYEVNNFQKFKGFIIGASIGYLTNYQKWKRICKLKLEYLKVNSKHDLSKHIPSYFPVSCTAYAKIFGCCIRTASKHKKLAKITGYIKIKKVLNPIYLLEKKVEAKYASHYKKANPEIAHKVRIINGYLHFEDSDLIQPSSSLEYSKKHSSFSKRSS